MEIKISMIALILVSMINASAPKGGGQEVDAYSTIEKMNKMVLEFFDVYPKDERSFTSAGTH